MNQEIVSVLSALGDIKGSGVYSQRTLNDDKRSMHFWRKFDDEIDRFERKTGYFINHLGDGFLCVKKMGVNGRFPTVTFLNELLELKKEIDGLIQSVFPRPDGFHIHVAAGKAIQKVQREGNFVFHSRAIDLIGTTIKMEDLKEIPFVVTEAVKDSIIDVDLRRSGFQFELLKAPRIKRDSDKIYIKEISKLYSLTK